MIDNVVLIVTGTLHERDVNELLEKCHPLGMFDRYQYCFVCCFFNLCEIFRLLNIHLTC
jgi:V-type H+-transporting ATPase subunit d